MTWRTMKNRSYFDIFKFKFCQKIFAFFNALIRFNVQIVFPLASFNAPKIIAIKLSCIKKYGYNVKKWFCEGFTSRCIFRFQLPPFLGGHHRSTSKNQTANVSVIIWRTNNTYSAKFCFKLFYKITIIEYKKFHIK